MVELSNGSETTPCPDCGEPMGMVTWTGEKPSCPACSGATTTNAVEIDLNTSLDDDTQDFVERFRRDLKDETNLPCLAEAIEESRPPNHKGEPIMVACPCPKCSPRC